MATPRRLVLLAALAAAGLAGPPARPSDATAGKDATVTIDNFTFSPSHVTVSAGTRVAWTNRDDIPHRVTDAGQPRAFKSAALDTGDGFAFTFDKPGIYDYFCSLHPHMQGRVIVQ